MSSLDLFKCTFFIFHILIHCIDKTLSLVHVKYTGIRIGFRRNLSTPVKKIHCMFPILKNAVHFVYTILCTFIYVYKNDIGSHGLLSERAANMKVVLSKMVYTLVAVAIEYDHVVYALLGLI